MIAELRAGATERVITRYAVSVDAAIDAVLAACAGVGSPIQLRAAQDVLDRLTGRPADRSEISGPDGGPVDLLEFQTHIAAIAARRRLAAAEDLESLPMID